MTKVKIQAGPCGFVTYATAELTDDDKVKVTVDSPCVSVSKLAMKLDEALDPYSVCFHKPGMDPIHAAARGCYTAHAGCPVIIGIVRAVEAEAGLCLKKPMHVTF